MYVEMSPSFLITLYKLEKMRTQSFQVMPDLHVELVRNTDTSLRLFNV
jgi:hypothetical protein